MTVVKHQVKLGGNNFFQKVKSWLFQDPIAYSPNKMLSFLKSKGIKEDGINYFIFIEEKIRKYGIISIYEDVLFLSESDLAQLSSIVWEIPVKSIIAVTIEE